MGQVIFEAADLSYRYHGAAEDVLQQVSLRLESGELLCVAGPNGSGKTTLLRVLLGLLKPRSGEALILGKAGSDWKRRDLARVVGVVAQREEPAFPLKVGQAVMYGRYPHLGPLGQPGPADHRAVELAMEGCDILGLAGRWVATLSGGEWQRVRIARALAQSPMALVLDEPTANLDIRHEMEVFELVSQLVRSQGLAALLITHHVNLGARFADRMVVLKRGSVRAAGHPSVILSREVLQDVFDWPVDLFNWQGVPQFVPLVKDQR